jgi:hypothetical protein
MTQRGEKKLPILHEVRGFTYTHIHKVVFFGYR